MKKLLAISLSLSLLLLCAACGAPQKPGSAAPSDGESGYEQVMKPDVPASGEETPEENGDNAENGSTDGSDPAQDPAQSAGTDKPAAEKPASGKPAAEKPASGKPSSSKPASGKPSSSKPASGKPSSGKQDSAKADTAKGYSGTLPELIQAIYKKQPVDLTLDTPTAVDLTDSYSAQYFLGLSDASKVKEAYCSEPMIGSIAYSLVVVRTKDAADAPDVAKSMFNGINQHKWICVTADTLAVGSCGDTIVLAMVDSEFGTSLATDLRSAFAAACGGTLDVSLDRASDESAQAVEENGLALNA